jgi:hypothetical protein
MGEIAIFICFDIKDLWGWKVKNTFVLYAIVMRKLRLYKVCASGRYLPLWVFLMAFAIRALPEFLSGPYPVGYDLLAGYAPSILALPDASPLKLFGWFWSPLAVFVLWFFWVLTRVDLYLLLKVAGPVFYGLFVLSFYYLLLKGLGWGGRKSFVTALLFLLQPAVLRTGWDQLREELGFVFLFVLLGRVNCDVVSGAGKKPLVVVVLSVLVALSHQLAAVLLFVVLFWQFVWGFLGRGMASLKRVIMFVPFVVLFGLQLYLAYFMDFGFSSHFVPVQLPSGTSFFAFTNYFLGDPRFVGGDFFRILAYVGSLSLYCVVPLVPLAIKGFFRDKVFTPMLIWLCVASYSIVVFPWFAFSYCWWWILLLPIPLTVYAGHGLERLGVFAGGRQFRRMLVGFLLLSVVSVGYASSIIRLGYPYAFTYMPSGLVESCVNFEDIPDIKEAFTWANTHLPLNAVVIVPEKFQGFASMYSRSDLRIRIAPPLLGFNAVIDLLENKTVAVYAVYHTNEVGDSNNTIEILIKFGNVGIYRALI